MTFKTITQAILIAGSVTLPMQASATSILCIEEQSIGFNWRDGKWVQVGFKLDKYLITKRKESDGGLEKYCFDSLKERGLDNPAPGALAFSCYEVKVMGDAVGTIDECSETYDANGKLRRLECRGIVEMSLLPNGGFIRTQDYSLPDLDVAPDVRKDSLVLSVGTCAMLD